MIDCYFTNDFLTKSRFKNGIQLYEFEGLNPQKATVNTQRVAADRQVKTSVNLDGRDLRIRGSIQSNVEENERWIAKHFQTGDTVRFYINNSTVKFIDGTIEECNIYQHKNPVEFDILFYSTTPYFKEPQITLTNPTISETVEVETPSPFTFTMTFKTDVSEGVQVGFTTGGVGYYFEQGFKKGDVLKVNGTQKTIFLNGKEKSLSWANYGSFFSQFPEFKKGNNVINVFGLEKFDIEIVFNKLSSHAY
jgi:hypothetical protein